MLKLKKLYSVPKQFETITFVDGFNLILGETTEDNVKTNGVGKSMAIEFINYGLLKKHIDSRVALIPEQDFPSETTICLDFEIADIKITSKRTPKENECPTLVIDGISKVYSNLSDANNHLKSLLFKNVQRDNPPSFRAMMGPLIRDEGSEFKSIIKCFDTNKTVPPNYTPHLWLLHIDPAPYIEAKNLYREM